MNPSSLFQLANMFALSGWAALILGIVLQRAWLRVAVASRAVPIILAIFYTALVFVAWPVSQGGYSTLGAVARLFEDPRMLLAGWAHYLAFDLLIGGWIADEVDRRGLTRWLLLPALPLTFLFGPAGLLVFFIGAVLPFPKPRNV